MISGVRACQAQVLGHECAGIVESVGRGVIGYREGERVIINPVNPERAAEVIGHSIDGCLQERFIANAALVRQGRLVAAPNQLPLPVAALAEPLAAVIYGFELVEHVTPVRSVAVFGAGPIGLMVCILARIRGAHLVRLVHNRESRFAWAVSQGIVDKRDGIAVDDLDSIVRSGAKREMFDAAFVCVPRPASREAFNSARRIARAGGVIDMVSAMWDFADAEASEIDRPRGELLRGAALRTIFAPGPRGG